MARSRSALHIRWLGRVPFGEAHDLQRALHASDQDYLLLLEHPPVYTLGVRADRANILIDPRSLGVEVARADRGGDVTFHAPGQLVGYPILTVPGKGGPAPGRCMTSTGATRATGMADTVAFVRGIEDVIIDALTDLGLPDAGRMRRHPGVWVGVSGSEPRKICAIGVKLSRGRSMHGFALNVTDEPLRYAAGIVPCGIPGRAVTSLCSEGVQIEMRAAAEAVARRAAQRWGAFGWDRADVQWQERPDDLSPFSKGAGAGARPVRMLARLSAAGVDASTSVSLADRKPEWLRVKMDIGPEYRRLRQTVRSLSLVTVCEEAGCPNIFDCWNDGTATFMVLGGRCTRACGFCLVDTSKPAAPDPLEPERVAEAVARLGLAHVVLTMVARDDLVDGGADHVAGCVRAIRARAPEAAVEVLISDLKGDLASLHAVIDARPDVLNHNVETVARLQRAVRPSAGYARSLSVLARCAASGVTTKSGLMVGLGESPAEVHQAMADLRSVGVRILTIGQYLRPTTNHLPVARWWDPAELSALADHGRSLGFAHVEASPLARSSYHARQGAEAAGVTSVSMG